MAKKSIGAQVKSGFRLTGLVLLMLGWLGLVFAGLIAGVAPGNAHRPVLGLGLLVLAAAILLWTMDRWIKVFPGLLALATLNAVASILTGHATSNPSVRIPPTEAAITAGLLAASTVVSFRFTKPKLTLRVLDRIAVFGFICCIFWAAVDDRVEIIAPAVACGLVVVAWGYDVVRRRGRPNHHSSIALEDFPGHRVK
jgi:uncharacterized integral membrane protein